MESAAIGVFDSGLGGLTVAREIARALPDESLIYVGDTARWPYGPRDFVEVRRFILEIGCWLQAQKVKFIVIACNTATAAGLTLAQRAFSVPVIGVIEPGARAAVMATRNRRVGVIGTVGTIESGAYSSAVRALDAGVTVFSVPTPRFVDIAEEGLRLDTGPVEGLLAESADVFVRPSFHEIARNYLDPLRRNDIDTLVLGCTHYPLLSAAIQQVAGSRVQLISSAEETANEVAETLARREQLAPTGSAPRHHFAVTGDTAEFEQLGSRVLGTPITRAEKIPIGVLEGLPGREMLALLDDQATREASCA